MYRKFVAFAAAGALMLTSLSMSGQSPSARSGSSPQREFKSRPTLVNRTTDEVKSSEPKQAHDGRDFKRVAPSAPVSRGEKVRDERGRRAPLGPYAAGKVKAPLKVLMQAGEVKDENGIITSPGEGVRKVYTRAGMSYKNIVDEGLQTVAQSGQVHIVECEDGTVYIRNIVSSFGTGAWVKGTRDGNTITVPIRQPLIYRYEDTASITWGVEDLGFSTYHDYADHFTFTVDDEAGTISLDGTSASLFMGVFWDADGSFAFAGDYESVWTYSHDFVPMEPVTVTPPAGLTTQVVYSVGHVVNNEELEQFRGTVVAGLSGNKVYIKGLFADFPDAWMVGTISGTTVTFDGLQELGEGDGYTVYAVGSDGNDLEPFTMTIDVEKKQLKSNNVLLANADDRDVYYVTWINDLTLSATDPYAPIETLPYSNNLDTREQFEWFTVIDANEDGRTWRNVDEAARYHYSSENDADDWLFSPLFKLDADKVYRLTFDCKAQSYPERFEVKLGYPDDIENFEATLLEPTQVEWDEYQTTTIDNIKVSASGDYSIGFHCISFADNNVLFIDNFLLEEIVMDAPAAVTDLTVTPDEEELIAHIAFTAPSVSIGGDALTDNLSIDIKRDGNVVKTLDAVAPGASVNCDDDDEALTVGKHTYQVVARNAAGEGAKSEAVTVVLSKVLDVPYIADFTGEDAFNQFVAIDANDDLFTWQWNEDSHAFYSYHSENDADDYLVSPPLRMEAGKNYAITVNAGALGYPEEFEVVVGTEASVEGLSTVVIEKVVVQDEDNIEFDGTFTAPADGAYFVAVHCVSPADQYELWIHRLAVEAGPEADAPAAPAVEVTADATGELQATVVVTAPTLTVGGDALSGNLEKIEIYRDGELVNELTDVAAGATVNYVDNLEQIGDVTYHVIAYNAAGAGLKSDKVKVHVGVDVPLPVENLAATDKVSTVLFTWDKVGTTGANGYVVNPAMVDYKIYGTHEDDWFGLIQDDEPLDVVRDADSYEMDFDTTDGDQQYKVWTVVASNDAGDAEATQVSLLVGKPFDLPMIESFESNRLHYLWESNGTMLISSDASDDDGVALALTSGEIGEVFLTSGKINLADASRPTLLFDAQGQGIFDCTVIGTTDAGEVKVLAQPDLSEEYTEVSVPLDEIKGGQYAMIGFLINVANPTTTDPDTDEIIPGDAMVIDNIRVVDLKDHELSVTLSAPSQVTAGNKAVLLATVQNLAGQQADAYTVLVKAGGQVLLEQEVTEPLASFKSTAYQVEWIPAVIDEPGDVEVTAQVVYADDENPDNNEALATVTVVEPQTSAPENLTATNKGASGVDLSWSAPATAQVDVVEDVEDTDAFPAFSVGGITAATHTGALGDWSLYDGNGMTVYGWQSEQIGYVNAYEPAAWQVFDPQLAGFPQGTLAARSGNQYLLSMCPNEDGEAPAADHWLISPELSGAAQTIRFFAHAITANYGAESFEVLASSTGCEPEDFELVEYFSMDEEQWTEFAVDVPAGTRYFAIRHTSQDIFGMMVDDLSLLVSGELAGYNIYVDGVQVGTAAADATTFNIEYALLGDGMHEFAVTAVYGNGEESKPARASVASAVTEVGVDTAPVDVYTVDGKLVRRGATDLEGLDGIYITTGGKKVVK